MALPAVGLIEVDKLILRAVELGLKFPPDVKRWQLLNWAASALELQRQDPTAFARDGLRKLTREMFPTANP
jgi:hypothetical protein